jgi:hypothetical protein
LIAAPQDWAGNLGHATAFIRELQIRTAHQETRDSCALLLSALASLEAVPAEHSAGLLASELQRDQTALSQPSTSMRERDVLRFRQQLLRHRLLGMSAGAECQIPRVVHLIKTDPRTDDLPLLQYLCYRTVLGQCKGYRCILHASSMPQGARWQTLLPRLETDIGLPPQHLGNVPIIGAAHQSDVWRLQHLITHGGFYFDWDLLLLRPPDHLRGNVCVMALEGLEPGYREVLGVAAIGAEPGSQFLVTWLATMPSVFDPQRYVGHSTVLAHFLALKLLPLIRLLDHRSFYYPGWTERAMRWLFDPARCLPEDELQAHLGESTGIHLFCSHANFQQWAASMTEKDIESGRCNLTRLMRPYL